MSSFGVPLFRTEESDWTHAGAPDGWSHALLTFNTTGMFPRVSYHVQKLFRESLF